MFQGLWDSEIFSYLQANKLSCQSFIDINRRQKAGPEMEEKSTLPTE